jgi:hypothetical protein
MSYSEEQTRRGHTKERGFGRIVILHVVLMKNISGVFSLRDKLKLMQGNFWICCV